MTTMASRHTKRARLHELLRRAKARAERKGREFDLDTDWLDGKIDIGHCEQTGIAFDMSQGNGRSPWTPSFDRIDNSKGYTKDNTQIVVWAYNAAKGEGTDSDVLRLCKALIWGDISNG